MGDQNSTSNVNKNSSSSSTALKNDNLNTNLNTCTTTHNNNNSDNASSNNNNNPSNVNNTNNDNNNSTSNTTNNSYLTSDSNDIQRKIQICQLHLYRQASIKATKNVRNTDIHSKINRLYSKILVDYHWLVLIIGVFVSIGLTSLNFTKFPLPDFSDPKRGFGARGEGTLTSQLIVMKNINSEITKYHKNILELYERIKKENRSTNHPHESSESSDLTDNPNSDYQYNSDTNNNMESDSESDSLSLSNPDFDFSSDSNVILTDDSQNKPKADNNLYSFNYEDDDEFSKKPKKNKHNIGKRSNYDPDYDADEGEEQQAPGEFYINDANMDYSSKFYEKHEHLLSRKIYKKFTGFDIINMTSTDLILKNASQHALRTIEHCNYSLVLNHHLEFYFSASDANRARVTLDELYLHDYYAKFQDELKRAKFNSHHHQEKLNDTFDWSSNRTTNDWWWLTTPAENESDYKRDQLLNATLNGANLLNVQNLKSLCEWDKQITGMLAEFGRLRESELCYLSLPSIIVLLNNKTDCASVNERDVEHFLDIVLKCYRLHATGIMFGFAEEHKDQPEIINLLNKNNPIKEFIQLPEIKENLCFRNDLLQTVFEHILDREFLSERNFLTAKVTSLLLVNNVVPRAVANVTRMVKQFNNDFIFKFYMKYFHNNEYDDETTKMIGINLMGIREEAAMRLLSQEMLLVAIAITLIVVVTLLYLRSIFISMIVNVGVGLSVGVAFFLYRILFDIELFPFINMMAVFLLIGIACDNVYVLFDTWYNEKARIILEDLPDTLNNEHGTSVQSSDEPVDQPGGKTFTIYVKRKLFNNKKKSPNGVTGEEKRSINSNETELFLVDDTHNSVLRNSIYRELLEKNIDIRDYELNPTYIRESPLTDEQMIRVMGGTLRHAASSIFVTSFTTAAAFFTNFITKLPYVQLFGVFAGICILIYFVMVITMIAAFVITYEKYIQPYKCKFKTNLTDRLRDYFEHVMTEVGLLNNFIISKKLPWLLIKFRVLFFCIFLVLGVCGMLVVFYKPKLKPPTNWRYQFFNGQNMLENFEFELKDKYLSYSNDETRNLTNPEIFFVFGIRDKDTGRLFNPDDDGHLIYDRDFDFLDKNSQLWLNKFINTSIAARRDLFLVDEMVDEWTTYLYQMQQFCYETMNISADKIHKAIYLPYERESLSRCRDEINGFLVNSSLENFENLMSTFPRRIIFISNGSDVNGLLLRINANRTFFDFDAVERYYHELKEFYAESFVDAPKGFDSGWFITIAFALYDLQYQLITGTYSSLVASMIIALGTLLLTSGNIFISIFAIITISFSIADTIAIFVLMGWNLSILESVVIIMSVGLSVDFVCHYGVAYINSDREFNYDNSLCCNNDESVFEIDPGSNNMTVVTSSKGHKRTKKRKSLNGTGPSGESSHHHHHRHHHHNNTSNSKFKFFHYLIKSYKRNNNERFIRINDIFKRVGSAVLMASLTTFLAGFSMYPSRLTSFSKMGQFLMLVMCTSYLFSTFFFVPLCALLGPTKNFGNLRLKNWFFFFASKCCSRIREQEPNTNAARATDDDDDDVTTTAAAATAVGAAPSAKPPIQVTFSNQNDHNCNSSSSSSSSTPSLSSKTFNNNHSKITSNV